MLRYKSVSLSTFAVVVPVAIAFAVSAFKNSRTENEINKNPSVLVDYYFRFDGADGEETDETKWTQIDAADFNSTASCTSIRRGCKLKTTMITGTSGVDAHPQLVEVDGTAPNVSPKTSVASGVTQVKNRVPNY